MHKFNLIENAKDSLNHAIEHLGPVKDNTTGDWKRVITDLSHVVELLFKERLRRIHPVFIFNNIDKYPLRSAFTVGAEKAFVRLQKIDGLNFSDSDKQAVKATREKRNEIEHFEFSLEDQEAKVIVGQTLSFILRFAEEHLELEWNRLCFKNNNWRVLYEYKEFYESLKKNAQEKIETYGNETIECPFCLNDSFDIDEEKCLICGHIEDVLICSNEWCKEPFFQPEEYEQTATICLSCEDKAECAEVNKDWY